MNFHITNVDYAALRHEGASAARAQILLGLADPAAAKLEKHFQRRKWGSARVQRPAFARHGEHVAAVLRGGGYPVLPESRR